MCRGKPFVHLLKIPLGYYMFDVNTNIVLEIDKETYTILHKCMNNECNSEFCYLEENRTEMLDSLEKRGYLSSEKLKEIVHPADELLEYRLNNKISRITLQVTQECNLRCDYCIYSGNSYLQRSHTNKSMSFETAKNGIDFLIEHSKDLNTINVGFYGGEPLLEFDLVKKCIEYAEERAEGKEITFSLTTNATLLTENIVGYFEKHNMSLMISLDGPKKIHDKSRKFAANGFGSFDVIMRNVEEIGKKFPEYFKKIFFSVVINPEEDFSCINEFFANYDTIKDAGIMATLVNDTLMNEKHIKTDDFKIRNNYEIFKIYLCALGKISTIGISRILLRHYHDIIKISTDLKPIRKVPNKGHHGGPCVPGEDRLFMSTDGYFYPCEKVSEISDVMKIGHIDTGFDFKKARNMLNIGKITEESCKNCWALLHCRLCAISADNIKDFSANLKQLACKRQRNSADELLKNYLTLRELGCDFRMI